MLYPGHTCFFKVNLYKCNKNATYPHQYNSLLASITSSCSVKINTLLQQYFLYSKANVNKLF